MQRYPLYFPPLSVSLKIVFLKFLVSQIFTTQSSPLEATFKLELEYAILKISVFLACTFLILAVGTTMGFRVSHIKIVPSCPPPMKQFPSREKQQQVARFLRPVDPFNFTQFLWCLGFSTSHKRQVLRIKKSYYSVLLVIAISVRTC